MRWFLLIMYIVIYNIYSTILEKSIIHWLAWLGHKDDSNFPMRKLLLLPEYHARSWRILTQHYYHGHCVSLFRSTKSVGWRLCSLSPLFWTCWPRDTLWVMNNIIYMQIYSNYAGVGVCTLNVMLQFTVFRLHSTLEWLCAFCLQPGNGFQQL